MTFAEFLALVTDMFSLSFPFSDTVDVTLGQLVIWTIVLWQGRSFVGSFIR